MFTAICSRLSGQEVITADDAYRKVWKLDDWGYVQSRDGWICPECRQPVFLKGPHERVGKADSFVVQAHFCHHSAAAAANCALFRSGGVKRQNQAEAIYSDRKQSLRRFFAGAPETADFLAALLGGEEESLREAARDIGISRREYDQPAKEIEHSTRHSDLTAELIHARLGRVDSFLAGVFVLGADHKAKVRNGFLAVKGRKNRLRSLFIEFGRNRKKYFQLLSEAGLTHEHDVAVSQLASQVATEIEVAKQGRCATYNGMALKLLEDILGELGLVEEGEWPSNYRQYLHALPILGNRLQGFQPINTSLFRLTPVAPIASQAKKADPAIFRLHPIRITSSKRLLVEARVIDQLITQGSKLNGWTSFVCPKPNEDRNSYIAIPGANCILLTSNLCAAPFWEGEPQPLTSEILQADAELPVMIWDRRISLSPQRMTSQGVFIQKDELQDLREAMMSALFGCGEWTRGGMRYRRVNSGLRISTRQRTDKTDLA